MVAISEDLKKIEVGVASTSKERERGKPPPPEIAAGKGRALFTPQFGQKSIVKVIIPEKKEE